MRTTARLAALVACGAIALGACVETQSNAGSTDPGTESHLDDGPVDLLHDRGAARDAIEAIEAAVGASPARVREVLVYPEFLDTEVQDPAIPEHLDEYGYRDGTVEAPEAVLLSGPQEDVEASLFPTTALDWSDLPSIVARVERAARRAEPLRIEDARVTYLIVRRSTSSDDDGRVEITAYVSGPRRSGDAELTASGELVSLTVH